MKLLLVALNSASLRGKSIAITGTTFIIGRNPVCHLRPSSSAVSRFHSLLTFDGRRAHVRDLGSTTGTFVNEQQIEEEVELRYGDRIRVGPLVFEVRMDRSQEDSEHALRGPHRTRRSLEDLAASVLLTM